MEHSNQLTTFDAHKEDVFLFSFILSIWFYCQKKLNKKGVKKEIVAATLPTKNMLFKNGKMDL